MGKDGAVGELEELRGIVKVMRQDLTQLDSDTLGNRRSREEFKKSLQGRLEDAEAKLEHVSKVVTAYQGNINRYIGIFLTALVTGAAGFLLARLGGG